MSGRLDNQSIIERLSSDKQGLIKQSKELKEGISELRRRLFMVEGALQYVSNLLANQEDNNGGQ